jgi:hypothetical protein
LSELVVADMCKIKLTANPENMQRAAEQVIVKSLKS